LRRGVSAACVIGDFSPQRPPMLLVKPDQIEVTGITSSLEKRSCSNSWRRQSQASFASRCKPAAARLSNSPGSNPPAFSAFCPTGPRGHHRAHSDRLSPHQQSTRADRCSRRSPRPPGYIGHCRLPLSHRYRCLRRSPARSARKAHADLSGIPQSIDLIRGGSSDRVSEVDLANPKTCACHDRPHNQPIRNRHDHAQVFGLARSTSLTRSEEPPRIRSMLLRNS